MAIQAGYMLNVILSELAQTFDFGVALVTTTVNLTAGIGTGPYPLPALYLRMSSDILYIASGGVANPVTKMTLQQLDNKVAAGAAAAIPTNFTTDISLTPPNLYVWPPANGSLTLPVRYYSGFADIVTPETSSQVPWFPCQAYLNARLLADLYALNSKQELAAMYRQQSMDILWRYLYMQGDRGSDSQQILSDRRMFGQDDMYRPPEYRHGPGGRNQ
ncbi:MAG: hypothetical protein PHS14_19490 [Elusimicrobia bacterium]|nr:hypothetical protein [Elusimicrobiota bacterium]